MKYGIRFALLAAIAVSTLPAAVIFDNGGPSTSLFGTRMSDNLVADDFTLGATTDITNIRFWTLQSALGDYAGSVYWAIYSDSGSLPNAIIQGGVTATLTGTATGNTTGFGYAEYLFDIPVTFQLTAGSYWLALHNGGLANTGGANPPEILWSTTAGSLGTLGVYQDLVNLPGTWVPNQDQAFQLMGAEVGVPEPSSWLLLTSGLVAGAYLRRRR